MSISFPQMCKRNIYNASTSIHIQMAQLTSTTIRSKQVSNCRCTAQIGLASNQEFAARDVAAKKMNSAVFQLSSVDLYKQ